MIHLKKFETESEFETAKPNLVEPWVTLTMDNNMPHFMNNGSDPEPTFEYVDLGLPSGLKWATCNVGAKNPWEYGKYFQWGDTVGYEGDDAKAHSSWSTAPFNGGSENYNEEAFNAVSGTVCPNGVLAPEYDAAHVNMGENWHMPTSADFKELTANTNSEWVTNYEGSGVNGNKLTSKTDSSKYIFIPASGWGSAIGVGNWAYLWSSSLDLSNPSRAVRLYLGSGSAGMYLDYRYIGCVVRGCFK